APAIGAPQRPAPLLPARLPGGRGDDRRDRGGGAREAAAIPPVHASRPRARRGPHLLRAPRTRPSGRTPPLGSSPVPGPPAAAPPGPLAPRRYAPVDDDAARLTAEGTRFLTV